MAVNASSASGPAPATILLVDDDEGMRHVLRRMLERTGYAIIVAAHGLTPWRVCASAVDLVVTDMVMPEMDGIELVRTLAVEQPTLPIIAISGVHDWANYLSIAPSTLAARLDSAPANTGETRTSNHQ